MTEGPKWHKLLLFWTFLVDISNWLKFGRMIAPWYFIYFKMRENNFSLLFFMIILLFLVVPCYLISSSIWYCFSNKQLAILELIAIVHTGIRLSEIIITAPKKNRPVNFFVAVFGPAANYSIIIPNSILTANDKCLLSVHISLHRSMTSWMISIRDKVWVEKWTLWWVSWHTNHHPILCKNNDLPISH